MVKKKVDSRVRTLLQNSVNTRQRGLMVLVGDRGKDQVPNIHYLLSKTSHTARPNVLWCYNKELGFSTHRQKRMREIKKAKARGTWDDEKDDAFELFIGSTNVNWCYYRDTARVLGQTYGMLVLQDFEALTPNLLCRTIETVQGGGLVILLLRTMTSLRQLYTMTMDVHSRYRTEAFADVKARFNERFLLSLTNCGNALVLDDELNVLPISATAASIEPIAAPLEDAQAAELREIQAATGDTEIVGALAASCVTLDQAKAVLSFAEAIADKSLSATVAMTAGRGRGKSAAMGLAVAAAIAFGYANIFVTSPSPDNLGTFFEFVTKGLEALAYKEHLDWELHAGTQGELRGKALRVVVKRERRQVVQYISPSDADKLGQAELLVIDEAAAIPLPLVRRLLGPYLVFLSSTVNGYEGTGRSLSLKLIKSLRTAQTAKPSTTTASAGAGARSLVEISLEQPIRYAQGDPIERWMNDLLCLDATSSAPLARGLPGVEDCDLYLVNRDALFSYHKLSEQFLHQMMALYVASHYKNTPNDLQLLADSPAQRLFALLGPPPADGSLPDVLCVVQVALEGRITQSSVQASMARGARASGDLIPWAISTQFQDQDFPTLSGARIVRIATHPNATRMGYGSRALQLLTKYFEGQYHAGAMPDIAAELDDEGGEVDAGGIVPAGTSLADEHIKPRAQLPPLLMALEDAPPCRLHWMGVSYGLTQSLFSFWHKAGYCPVYLRQTANELTGEHTCIMVRPMDTADVPGAPAPVWLPAYSTDFCRRFLRMLGSAFRGFDAALALAVAEAAGSPLRALADAAAAEAAEAEASAKGSAALPAIAATADTDVVVPGMDLKSAQQGADWWKPLAVAELLGWATMHDLQRLRAYAKNMVDYHMVADLLPPVASLFFLHRLPGLTLSRLQAVTILGMGCQGRSADEVAEGLNVPATQLLALFNKAMRKFSSRLQALLEQQAEAEVLPGKRGSGPRIANGGKAASTKALLAEPMPEAVADSMASGPGVVLSAQDMEQYKVAGTDADWADAAAAAKAATASSGFVSVKRDAGSSSKARRKSKGGAMSTPGDKRGRGGKQELDASEFTASSQRLLAKASKKKARK